MIPHLPADVLVRVAEILDARDARGTLSALSRTSRGSYEATAPVLYSHLVLGTRASGLLSALSVVSVADFPGFDDDGHVPPNWSASRATLRVLAAWSHVRRVSILTLPRDHETRSIAQAASALPPGRLMPKLASVCIKPVAVDQLRIWTPDSNLPATSTPSQSQSQSLNLPPLLEALAHQRPRRLCVAFRQVPAAQWEEYRDASTRGQYALVRRIESLAAAWELSSVHFHDIVHQVLPSLPTRNVYDFAPPAVPHPLFRGRYRFPRAREGVRLPGVDWTIRPWQMGLAIKNLFPSSRAVDEHRTVLERTSWEFGDVTNHILTKEERDDDDSTGVWWAEVKDMIDDSIRVGMGRDLPARGLDHAFVDEVFEKVVYRRVEGCEACGRDVDEHNVMSLDGLDLL